MIKNFRKKFACFISPEYRDEADAVLVKGLLELNSEKGKMEYEINKRVAETLLKMDPFEPLLRKYHGVFSDAFDRPEDNLDSPSQMKLSMWAYGQKHDIQGNFFSNWILNSAGNDLIKLTNPSIERIGYHRALIANEILRKREIGRLALAYEELIKKKDDEFDSSVGVE